MTSPEDHRSAEHGTHGAVSGLGGLAVSSGGYTLQATPLVIEPGRETNWKLRILNSLGNAVRAFETLHERGLHLVVVRRDLAHFQHLHPSLGEDGTWSVSLALPTGGSYRAFADFQVGGAKAASALGIDLAAPGQFLPVPAPTPATIARNDDYEVQLGSGPWKAGAAAKLTFSVRRHGESALELEPYLGAQGHLVILREGDLAYLHVHPLPVGRAASVIDFRTEFPSAGRYRSFLQFAHRGAVHTAEFTIAVTPSDVTPPEAT